MHLLDMTSGDETPKRIWLASRLAAMLTIVERFAAGLPWSLESEATPGRPWGESFSLLL